uniref:Protein of function n=1 Tax=Xenopsylla cheopis TaxID=163159 RepID=A0A6M2DJA4_XENCH
MLKIVNSSKQTILRYSTSTSINNKPTSSETLSCYLKQCKEPPWTSYFIKYKDVQDDQWGMSNFNWTLDTGTNYHILRTGCFPFMKYHCTKQAREDLRLQDIFYRAIKITNLGIPCLAYGLAASFLVKHKEIVRTPKGDITIYFLYAEDKGSLY